MGKSGPSSTTTVTKSELPEFLKPYSEDFVKKGVALSEKPYEAYGGQRIADFAPAQTQGLDMTSARALAGNQAVNAGENMLTRTMQGEFTSPFTGSALAREGALQDVIGGAYTQPFMQSALARQNQLQNTMGGAYLTPESNPYLRRNVDTALSQVGGMLNSQFNKPGAFGNTAHQEVMARSLGDVASNMYGQNYAQERQNQLSAAGMGSQDYMQERANQMSGIGMGSQDYMQSRGNELQASAQALGYGQNDYIDLQNLRGVGDVYQQREQDLLNQQYQDWLDQQNWGLRQQDILGNTIGMSMGNTGTVSSTAPNPNRGNSTANLLGAGQMGAGLLNMM